MLTAFTIAGHDVLQYVRLPSIEITDELNARNTCRFQLHDRSGQYRPAEGQPVSISWDLTVIFAGTIDHLVERILPGTPALSLDVDCVDFNQLCDRHIVTAEYLNQTLKAVVQGLLANNLAGEGLTLDAAMETGPTLDHIVFPDVTVTQALNSVSELTGYAWYIDYAKVLHVFSREFFAAPFPLDDLALWRNLTVSRARDQYRNQQYVIGGQDIANAQAEQFHGDSKQTSFVVALPIALVPTVEEDRGAGFIMKTVGIRSVESGKDWYWNQGETSVSQDDAGTKLSSTDTLRVTYQGFFDIKVQGRDQGAIDERAAVEGGTGLYEAVEKAEEITRSVLAIEKSDGLLRRFARIATTIDYETFAPGLRAGQLQPVNLLRHRLVGTYLIVKVELSEVSATVLRYRVSAVNGEAVGGWVEFFRKLVEAGRKTELNANQVIMYLRNFQEGLQSAETFSSATAATRCGMVGDPVGFAEVCA